MKKDIIPYIDSVENLKKEFNKLYQERLVNKQLNKSIGVLRNTLSKDDRLRIYEKTEGNCHVCGCILEKDGFEADHVVPKTLGGNDSVDNFLPACSTCNSYRWNYSPEEIQWILKLGVWLKTKMLIDHNNFSDVIEEFIADEIIRENRRKLPRSPKASFDIPLKKLFPIKGKRNNGFIEVSADELEEVNIIIEQFQLNENVPIVIDNSSFLLSGEACIPRDELKVMISDNGGKLKSSISKNVNYLVLGNFYGYMKLKQLEDVNRHKEGQIKIISIEALVSILKQH